MSPKKSTIVKNDNNRTAIIVAVIGFIGTVITAYFGFLANTRSTANTTALSTNDQSRNQNSPAKFLPISNKELLIQGFRFSGFGKRVNLRFVAENFDLDFNFSAPVNTSCYSFLHNFLDHFAFSEYIQIDMSNFPTGLKGGIWEQDWAPVINGKKVDDCQEQTLQDMAVMNGDLIGLKLGWHMVILVSSEGGDPTGETAINPPDINP